MDNRLPADDGNSSLIALSDISTPNPHHTGADILVTAALHSAFLPHPFRKIKPDLTVPFFISLSFSLFSSVPSSGSTAAATLLCLISSKNPTLLPFQRRPPKCMCLRFSKQPSWRALVLLALDFLLIPGSLACSTALFLQPFCCSLPALTNVVLTSWSPGAPPPLPSTDTCAADGTNGLAIIQCLSPGLPCLVLVMVARQG